MSARPAKIACLAVLLGTGCGERGQGPGAPVGEPLASLVLAAESVNLTRAGKSASAALGPLYQDDAVATGAGGRAVLRFKGGRTVEIGENARFVLSQATTEATLEISEGVVVSRLGPASSQGGGVLSILTPAGLSRVPANGEAVISVAVGGATTLEVHTGEITFVGKDGKQLTAHAGEKLEVVLGEVKIVAGRAASPDAGASATVQLDPIAVTLSADRGQVLVKGAQEKKFHALGKGADAPLEDGGSFKLLPGGHGLLSGGGLRVRLQGGGEGTLAAAVRDAGGERFSMSLEKGSAQILASGGGRHTLVLGGASGEISAQADDAATFTFAREGKAARAEVQAGEVQLTYGGATKTVQAGEVAELGKGLVVTPKARPALTLPTGRRVRVWASGLREVGLTWPAADGATRVEVSADGSFKDVMLSGKAVGSQVIIVPPASGELHWRVLGKDGEALSKGQALFAPEKIVATVGGHPVGEVAETGLKATIFYQSALPALVFSFPPVEGAARYRVRLYKADDLQSPLLDKTVADHKCAAEPGKVGEGSYLWNATPLSAAGAEIAGGRMNKLDVVYDNAIVSLTIDRPQPDEAAGSAATVATRGVAPLGTRLFINGKQAPLDPRGRFDLEVPRAAAIVFRLVGADGSESFWIRSPRAR